MSPMRFYISFLVVSLRLGHTVLAQEQNVQFNQVANINGDMQLNRLIFPDNTKIETFSQTQRQVLVNQNPNPLSANHVVGSTGQPFVALSQNSITIASNNASDLVGAQIELPIDPAVLAQAGVTADNTFVAMLSPDRQAWMVVEPLKSVNSTDNTVRIVKLNSIDGEYLAIGRQTPETGNSLSPFGTAAAQSVKVAGTGLQELEFQDGFRMTVRTNQPMTINTDVVNGVSSSMMQSGTMPVNNYRYLVQSNLAGVSPNLNQMMAVVQVPLNMQRLMSLALQMGAQPGSTLNVAIAQRGVLQNPGGAQGVLPQKFRRQTNGTQPPFPEFNPNGTATSVGPLPTGGAREPLPTEVPTNSTAGNQEQEPSPTQDANNPPPNNALPANPAASQLLLAPTFTPVASSTVFDTSSSRIAATVSQLDGEFIVTMQMTGAVQQPAGKRQVQEGQVGIQMTMEEIEAIVNSQKLGGMLNVAGMMSELVAQAAQSEAAAAAAVRSVPVSKNKREPRHGPRRVAAFVADV